jgi:trigger factor
MSVVRTVEDVGPCRKEIVIEVPAPAVAEETDRIVREYAKRAKLPGFRPGKVPPKVVRQRFREEIDQDVVERLVPRFWEQAEAESELDPLGRPQLAGIEDREEDGPLVFTASVEVRPEIELGNLESFQLPDPPSEPTEGEVEEMLEDLRRQAGDWVPVERPVGQGDLVSVAIEELPKDPPEADAPEAEGDEGADDRPEPSTVEIEIGSENVWEELSVALTGREEGQSGEFSRMEDEDGEVRERSFRFEVRGVKEQELPELDDELAAKFGDYDSVDALRSAVREQLGREKLARRREERETALLDQLRERHPLALPEGVVHGEIQGMLREYAEGLARRGVDLEQADFDWQAMAEQARPTAEKRVHARLLLDAVAKELDLEVAEDELERTLSQIAQSQQASATAVRAALGRDGRLDELRGQMRRGKALRRLLGEEDEEPAAAGSDAPDAEDEPREATEASEP